MFPSWAWKKLGIEHDERSVFGWSALTLFLICFTDASVTNVSETFFLKRVGVTLLPVVFLANSLLLVATTYVAGNLAARGDRLRLLTRGLLLLGIALLPLWGFVLGGVPGAIPVLVLASKQLKSIAALFFWLALSDLLHARQAKRLFGPILAGGTLGAIVGSFASAPIGRLLGIDSLLPISTVTLALAALSTLPLRRLQPARLDRESIPGNLPGGAAARASPRLRERERSISLGPLWRESTLFKLLVATALLSGLLGPMIFFQFSYLADAATVGAGGEQRLLDFYAQFRGWLQAGILAAQLLAVSRIFRRIGVPLAAAAVPVGYLLGFAGMSFRFDIGTATGAMAGTKGLDSTIQEPAQKFFFALFPDRIRPRVIAFLDETVERVGGSVGNVLVLLTLLLGSASWIGIIGIPFACLWLAAAWTLWRVFPTQLLKVAATRRPREDGSAVAGLVDGGTLRMLTPYLETGDPEQCRAAVSLAAEAPRDLAVIALARTARHAVSTNRPMILEALDRFLEAEADSPVATREAASELRALMRKPGDLSDQDRATVVQAYGRLASDRQERTEMLSRALEDPSAGVRLAALAALHASGDAPPDDNNIDDTVTDAIRSNSANARHIAREELRARLLRKLDHRDDEAMTRWNRRLGVLTSLLGSDGDRAATAEALAEIAQRHRYRAIAAAGALLAWRGDPDERVRAAALRFAGWAGIEDETEWMLQHVASEVPSVAAAAIDGLRALGSGAADVLVVALSFGKRSTRDAILPLVRELAVDPATLREMLHREVAAIHETTLKLQALSTGPIAPIVPQRLRERLGEGIHTSLLLLAAIHDDDEISDISVRLERATDRRERATLLEALDAHLGAEERRLLIPLLEERGLSARAEDAAIALNKPRPSVEEAIEDTLDGPDLLSRALLAATLDDDALTRHRDRIRALARTAAPVAIGSSDAVVRRIFAGEADLGDDEASTEAEGLPAARGDDSVEVDREKANMLSEVEIVLHLKTLQLFEKLTARQLADLARLVRQVSYRADTIIVREGEYGDCMYLILDGKVAVTKGETLLARLRSREFFGEMALFEGETRSATVTASEDVRLLRLERHDLLNLMEELPGIGIALCQTMSRRIREVSERLNTSSET